MPLGFGLQKTDGKPGEVFYPLEPLNLPSPPNPPPPGHVTIHLLSASLNHRDLFQRQHLYPGISFSTPILSDGCGLVVSPPTHPLFRKRVIINPARGWHTSPTAPDVPSVPFTTLGASINYPTGTLQETAVFDENELIVVPDHLDDIRAAALPLCGLTAWRAVFTKGQVKSGQNVLIPGIGGGVALMALQFCVKSGANVYVTSSSPEKIKRAVEELGAKGGVLYTDSKWPQQLGELLKKDGQSGLDVVVDGAGGDIVPKLLRVLKQGSKVVSYGMTTGPSIPWPMGAVLKNIELLGSTMGSRKEFREMVEWVKEKRVVPVVAKVVEGLEVEGLEEIFGVMRKGGQFGKLCVRIGTVEGAGVGEEVREVSTSNL